MNKKTTIFVLSLLFCTTWCFGYIDPGTGSYIVQVLIASVVAIGLGMKVFWNSIRNFFDKIFSKKKDDEVPEE